MIGLEAYSKIKNNYCICYFGQCDEYLVMLEMLRPHIERTFPGMNFYIGCRDESLTVFDNPEYRTMPLSRLKVLKDTFAHIKELKYENVGHPVEKIIEDSGVRGIAVPCGLPCQTQKATIITHGSYPTGPLGERQIEAATKFAKSRGFEPSINGDWKNSGMLIGVESVGLLKAAATGIPVFLAPTGCGWQLVKKMFSNVEIWTVNHNYSQKTAIGHIL